MAEEMYCEYCGILITDKGVGARYCRDCQRERLRAKNRQSMQKRRELARMGSAERDRAALNLAPPKLSIAEIALYAKEHGITYGKAVMELERRRGT